MAVYKSSAAFNKNTGLNKSITDTVKRVILSKTTLASFPKTSVRLKQCAETSNEFILRPRKNNLYFCDEIRVTFIKIMEILTKTLRFNNVSFRTTTAVRL